MIPTMAHASIPGTNVAGIFGDNPSLDAESGHPATRIGLDSDSVSCPVSVPGTVSCPGPDVGSGTAHAVRRTGYMHHDQSSINETEVIPHGLGSKREGFHGPVRRIPDPVPCGPDRVRSGLQGSRPACGLEEQVRGISPLVSLPLSLFFREPHVHSRARFRSWGTTIRYHHGRYDFPIPTWISAGGK